MNKYQKFYLDTTLEALDEQFNIVNSKLEKIYKKYYKDHKKLVAELSQIMFEYTIIEEKLSLTAKEKKKLKGQLQMTIYDMVMQQNKDDKEFIRDVLGDAIENTYEYQEYLLGLGIDFKSLPLTEEQINNIINTKVAGENWSNRLWNNHKSVEANLQKAINGFLNGTVTVNDIGKTIEKYNIEQKRYNTKRLVRTELCRVQQQIIEDFDQEHGVERQLFMATLDNKTSQMCRDFDGIDYDINDPSKPFPPVTTHPNCRSVLVGIPNKDYRPTTRRNNATGEIIDYTPYNEWINEK